MYNILMTNGKMIGIDAQKVEWYEKSRTLVFYDGKVGESLKKVARINIDNIVGWLDIGAKEKLEYLRPMYASKEDIENAMKDTKVIGTI